MKSMMIALLLALWDVPIVDTTGMSTNMANFLTLYNGNYDNLAQYLADNTSHNYIQMRTESVTIPAIPGRPVLFTEWSFNGKVFNRYLSDITEGKNGLIHLTFHNITDTNHEKPGEYNVDDLSKLNPEDFQRPSNCGAVAEPVGPGMFVGTGQACRHYVNGKHPLYASTITCDSVIIVIPRSATEESSRVPYNLLRKGDKFKVPDLPEGFVNPCS